MRKTVLALLISILTVSMLSVPFLMMGTGRKFVPAALPANTGDSSNTVTDATAAAIEASVLYDSLALSEKGLNKQILGYALKGYRHLLQKGVLNNENILSICDFSQSSRYKRFYIIDISRMKLLMNTYVAHGKNSGAEYARNFSNAPESHKTSLGFYVTRNTYFGGHGLSLKMQGLEKGFNDNAEQRNIVVHGADYIGADFLRYNHFSGRSYGCPALPSAESFLAINTIKDGSCLFIYHPTEKYLKRSRILNS